MIFSDGTIEAETEEGAFKFASMGDFKAYLAGKRSEGADLASRGWPDEPGQAALRGGASLPREVGKRDERPRAEMLDDFGGGERAEPRAGRQVRAPRHAREKARREHVAGAGRVDDLRDRKRRHLVRLVALDDDRAFFRSRHDRQHALAAAARRAPSVKCGVS